MKRKANGECDDKKKKKKNKVAVVGHQLPFWDRLARNVLGFKIKRLDGISLYH